ncbi:MAG: M2 family metallopeptidase [Deltaproteobacteria bacterium]|nr:M2 family metallopeptidase [Deltaproteobacteria bacterium]
MKRIAIAIAVVVVAAACQNGTGGMQPSANTADVQAAKPADTAEDARKFVDALEPELLDLWIARERTDWVKSTFITDDTDILSARANEAVMELVARKAKEAVRFKDLALPPDVSRKLELLRLSLDVPAPSDAAKRKTLAEIAAGMSSVYGKGKFCKDAKGGKCMDLTELSRVLAKSRNYDELLDAWKGWRTISPPMRPDYERFVALANEGARELGFNDVGDLWKARYDMPSEAFGAEVDRLWRQVRPLYEQLHCYVRGRLAERYGADKVKDGEPIPAHLLGNMWSQEWSNIRDIVSPPGSTPINIDKALASKKLDPVGMVRAGEAFYVSLGLPALPKTFFERSMFVRPRDRDVVCHASAWDIDWKDDLRIKMCIEVTGEDFTTIHHELGHNYYQRAYEAEPPLYASGANDGFHEALGDLMALSVTPSYLVKVGILDKEPPDNIGVLLDRALDKVAFLPFGVMIDRWRFDVFSGKTLPDKYNAHWWELIRELQGVAPPVPRSEADFDPGAKYHVPANVPYTRYFLAAILQFQMHRALCKVAGYEGPLHKCSIYGSKEAGARLAQMMALGQSKPWPEALKVLTGEDKMDATAILDYFKPLMTWLEEQNKGKKCGW